MINPAIIGLMVSAVTGIGFLTYASGIGFRIIRYWDIANGDEEQLILERKTALISVILYYVMLCEFLSLFLFVFIAEDLHSMFIGAMCAAGTLDINRFGYPVLVMKLVNVLLCGIWVIINYLDNKGIDYPIIRIKYGFLMIITLLVATESGLAFFYFSGLSPDIITSCCGTIFSRDADNIAGSIIVSLPPGPTKLFLFSTLAAIFFSGAYLQVKRKMALPYAFISLLMLPLGLTAILSFISVYYYELPTHHCPFCLLKKEYVHIGYILYPALFIAAVTGAGTGIVHCFRNKASLHSIVPVIEKRLSAVSMLAYAVFAAVSAYPMIFSDFRLP